MTVDSLSHGELGLGTTWGLTPLWACRTKGTWPLRGGSYPNIAAVVQSLSPVPSALEVSEEERAAKPRFFVIIVRCSSSVCPQEAELMSKKMPFSCSHSSAWSSLFMLWVQFCKNAYGGQHNLMIIEASGKFCFSENWQIKPIRQFLTKK